VTATLSALSLAPSGMVPAQALLPEGFVVPPSPYLEGLVVATAATLYLLYRVEPPLNQATVLAFAPWMVVGATLYAVFQLGVFTGENAFVPPYLPDGARFLLSAPAIYLTTFVVASVVWVVAQRYDPMGPLFLMSIGFVMMLGSVGLALTIGATRGTLSVQWPAIAVVVAALLTGGVWYVGQRSVSDITDAGYTGALAVFGHALDGTSTAVGADVLGFAEQTPLSRVILDVGAALPTEPYIGAGWLFVVVKVALVVVVVVLLADLVRDEPSRGYIALGLVAVVGLGPGAHNVVLFAVA